jgi:DNA repair exonuclease SbcCD ATPase subunit
MSGRSFSHDLSGFNDLTHAVLADLWGLSNHDVTRIEELIAAGGDNRTIRKQLRKIRIHTYDKLAQTVQAAVDEINDVDKQQAKETKESTMVTFKQYLMLNEDIQQDIEQIRQEIALLQKRLSDQTAPIQRQLMVLQKNLVGKMQQLPAEQQKANQAVDQQRQQQQGQQPPMQGQPAQQPIPGAGTAR